MVMIEKAIKIPVEVQKKIERFILSALFSKKFLCLFKVLIFTSSVLLTSKASILSKRSIILESLPEKTPSKPPTLASKKAGATDSLMSWDTEFTVSGSFNTLSPWYKTIIPKYFY